MCLSLQGLQQYFMRALDLLFNFFSGTSIRTRIFLVGENDFVTFFCINESIW